MDVFGRFRGQVDSTDSVEKARELEQSGLAHVRDGDLRMAKVDFRKAVGIAPKSPGLRAQLGGVLARLGEFEDADKELLTAIKLSPQDEALRFAHGQILEEMHRIDEAIAEYTLAAAIDPKSARSHAALSTLELKSGNLEDAERHVITALARDENEPQVWNNLTRIRLALLSEEQGDLDRGITMLLSARNSSPNDPGIQTALDTKMARRGKLSQAIELYRQLIAEPPADMEFYREMELSQLHPQQGDSLPRPGSDPWIDLMQAWLSSSQPAPQPPASVPAMPVPAELQPAQVGTAEPEPTPMPTLGTIWPDSPLLASTTPVVQSASTTYAARSVVARQDEPLTPVAPRTVPPVAVREETPAATRFSPRTSDPVGAAASHFDSTPAAPVRGGDAIGQLEFMVARDPGNSKLRRDLSILYLQAGRLPEAKEQARKAEELRAKRGSGPVR